MYRLSTLFVTAFAAMAIPALALDIKGLKPDMPLEEAKAIIATPAFMDKCRVATKIDPRMSCYYNRKYVPRQIPEVPIFDTFANRRVEVWMILYDEDRIDGVTLQMPTSNFDHILEAMTQKWGKPAKVKQAPSIIALGHRSIRLKQSGTTKGLQCCYRSALARSTSCNLT